MPVTKSEQLSNGMKLVTLEDNVRNRNDNAIYRTLEKMQELARADATNPVIQKIANEIRRNCAGDKLCRAKSAFEYVVKNVKYKYDHQIVKKLYPKEKNPDNVEFLARPSLVLTTTEVGDCDDMATLLCSLYIALGLPCRFKVADWKPGKVGFSHVYAKVYVGDSQNPTDNDSKWMTADAVKGEFDWELPNLKRSNECEVSSGECSINKLENSVKTLSGLTGLSGEYDKCVQDTYKRVNYNAGCIKKDCYSIEYVGKVIAAYANLLNEKKVAVYDREKNLKDIPNIEKATAEVVGGEPGQVSAVLYEMYFAIIDGLKASPADYKPCKGLVVKSMSNILWMGIAAGGVFAVGWLVVESRKTKAKQTAIFKKLEKTKAKLFGK